MLAKAIVTEGLDLVDIFDQRFFAGRGQMGVLPVALVQNESLIQQTVIQKNIASVNADLPHCGVRAYFVQNIAAFQ